jgi:hypothetical protein
MVQVNKNIMYRHLARMEEERMAHRYIEGTPEEKR